MGDNILIAGKNLTNVSAKYDHADLPLYRQCILRSSVGTQRIGHEWNRSTSKSFRTSPGTLALVDPRQRVLFVGVTARRRSGLSATTATSAVHCAARHRRRSTCGRPSAVGPGNERVERRRVGGVSPRRRPVVGRRAVRRCGGDAVAGGHASLEGGSGGRRRWIEANRRRVAGVEYGCLVTL